jgi:hypothetical protein
MIGEACEAKLKAALAAIAVVVLGCGARPLSAGAATDASRDTETRDPPDAGGATIDDGAVATGAQSFRGGPSDAADDGSADDSSADDAPSWAGDARLLAPLRSTQVVPVAGTLDALAIDGDGVYWVTKDNQLWALDTGSSMPRPLARARGASLLCLGMARLAVAGNDLFWNTGPFDRQTLKSELHRTAKSGADVVLVDGLTLADPPEVAVDGARVYWNEGAGSFNAMSPGAMVRSLSRDAAPGTVPRTLTTVSPFSTIAGIARVDSTLYWIDVAIVGATVYHPFLRGANADALWEQQSLGAVEPRLEAWLVRGYGGDLYVEHPIDSYGTRRLARIPADGSPPVDLAPMKHADEIVFIDQWALVSEGSESCGDPHHTLIAIPTTPPGGPVVQLADDLATPAILGSALVFGDAHGQLHVVALDEVRATLASAVSAR